MQDRVQKWNMAQKNIAWTRSNGVSKKCNEHTSSTSFFKEFLRYASKSNFSSTMSFMDFNSFSSFTARDSVSCICCCENAIALAEQLLVEVHAVLRLGGAWEKRESSRLPLYFCDFLKICLWFVMTFLWLTCT